MTILLSLIMWLILIVLVAALAGMAYSAVLAARCGDPPGHGEEHYVETLDFWKIRLRRFPPSSGRGEPVLLVHGLNANGNNFARPVGYSMVDWLSACGYDCWVIDVRGTRYTTPPDGRSRNEITIDDFVYYDLPAALDYIRARTGYERVHWIGHSLGGALLYMYVLAHGEERIASGVTLGSPVTFEDATRNVPLWLFNVAVRLPRFGGEMIRCLVPFARNISVLAQAFPVNPANIHPRMTVADLYSMLDDPAPEVHRQILRWTRDGQIILGRGAVNVTRDYPKIGVPLLAFFAARDPFVSMTQADGFMASIQSRDKKMVVCGRAQGFFEDYNHCDLAFSVRGEEEIFQPIAEWLAAHPCDRSGDVSQNGPAKPVAEEPGRKTESLEEETVKAESPRRRSRKTAAIEHTETVEPSGPEAEDSGQA
ncbi:MAG TPA: alpha/beta hydrolase [Candidatus Hydrogenedentes bacterium]|nr:alpha/beta hydrolase [Candidatus Hydrogenedentota bacterium]